MYHAVFFRDEADTGGVGELLGEERPLFFASIGCNAPEHGRMRCVGNSPLLGEIEQGLEVGW